MTGRRTLVLASAPRYCPLCAGTRRVQLVRLGDLRGAGVVACPHCNERLPVIHLPLRDDKTRSA